MDVAQIGRVGRVVPGHQRGLSTRQALELRIDRVPRVEAADRPRHFAAHPRALERVRAGREDRARGAERAQQPLVDDGANAADHPQRQPASRLLVHWRHHRRRL